MNETIKRYVVVKSSTGSIDLWTKAVYKRYLDGHTIGDGTGHPYTAITTFNADDRLADIPDDQFHKEPVTFLLSNALRHLTQDQQRQLANAIQERLPPTEESAIREEAERLYPDDPEDSMREQTAIKRERAAHISCAQKWSARARELEAGVEILKELCQLKNYKDTVGKDSFYEKRQPELWKAANDYLNSQVKTKS